MQYREVLDDGTEVLRSRYEGLDEQEIEQRSRAEFLRRMSTAYKLPLLVREIVPQIPALRATEDQIDGALDKIETVMENYYSGSVESVRKQLGDSLTILNMVSGNIATSEFAEPVLQDDFLDETRTELASIFNEIRKSKISDVERNHLLNLLDLMENAIVEVEIGGSAHLHAAASEVVGVIASEYPYRGNTPQRDRMVGFAWGVASSLAAQGIWATGPAIASGITEVFRQLPG